MYLLLLIHISLGCTFLIFIFVITSTCKKSKTYFSYSKSPPAPWRLPLLGHLHHLKGLPHHALYNLAKKHGPFLLLRLGEINTLLVTSPTAAKEILKTHDLSFANRPKLLSVEILFYNYASISFSPYGDYWRQLRKVCNIELLSAKKVQSMWPIMEEEVSNLIRNITSVAMYGGTINLTEAIASLSSDIICKTAFGDNCKDKDAFLSLGKEITPLLGGFDFADLFPSLTSLHWISGKKAKLQKLHEKVDSVLENIINDHIEMHRTSSMTSKSKGGEDIVDVFLRLHEEKSLAIPLEKDNIKAVIMDIFGGASETSSPTIVWAMMELIRNPNVMEKAQDEVRSILNENTEFSQSHINKLSYLHLVVKETLRLHPPVPLLVPRESRERCVVEGYEIPKGTKVIVNAWALGRDPDFWLNPERFEPERFQDISADYNGTNFSYIPFGCGRRKCPGISFAIANLELVLAQLLYHFDWKNSNDLDMTEAFGITVNKKFPLHLLPIIYHP